jgi:hypothetical protein
LGEDVMRARKVHTLESLLERTEDIGECMVWKGYSCNRTPQVDNQGQMVPVRRLILGLTGTPVVGRFIGVKCGTDLCVCPAHITQRSVKTHAKVMARAAASRRAAKATEQLIARRRRDDLKLNAEKAREIRESAESGQVLADRYGVSRSLVNKIKRGVYWRDTSNPFAGLI